MIEYATEEACRQNEEIAAHHLKLAGQNLEAKKPKAKLNKINEDDNIYIINRRDARSE